MLRLFALLTLLALGVSCGRRDLTEAEKSLEGTWKVTEIFSAEGDASGPVGNGPPNETGALGTFTFSGDRVTYNYTRRGITDSGTSSWDLTREMVPSSFTKVERYTLSLENATFAVRFGDQTSDAERNATEIELERFPAAGDESSHILKLTKA